VLLDISFRHPHSRKEGVTTSMDEYLEAIYYDPSHPASLSGPEKLYKWMKKHGRYPVTRKIIKKWLEGSEAYTLHREAKRKFPRNSIQVTGIDVQWDADLIDFADIAKYNDSNKYVLLCIDIFSRYVWLQPIKNKKAPTIIEAFEDVLSNGRKPKRLRTDKGGEFTSNAVKNFFKSQNILQMFAQNTEIKANYAERAIKTLKLCIHRYFTQQQTYKYIDKLQDFANSYNKSYHRSIKTTPEEVTASNEKEVWFTQYVEPMLKKPAKRVKSKLNVGDLVRITHIKDKFTREYNERWTGELFRIIKVSSANRIPMYTLKDYSGDVIKGLHYAQELQRATIDENKPYKIDKIIKTRKYKGLKQHYVRWKYWPPRYDSWINDTDLKDL
jgi:hypothetical protein